MCYSAQIKAECLSFLRQWGAALSLPEFVDLYWRRTTDAKVKIPRALYTLFAQPTSADERLIRELMETFSAAEATRLEQDLFKQRKRLDKGSSAIRTGSWS